jgi:hypothetical protein
MSNHNPPTNGFDKRKHHINRLGRPATFDKARELAKAIAHEEARRTVDGQSEQVVVNGHVVTVTEMILRSWAFSKNPTLQVAFMEWAYGKPSAKLEVGSPGDFDRLIDMAEDVDQL